MSLFGNQNFINQIAKEMGISHLQEDVAAVLQSLVQVQTRKFIQNASKFARSDARDQLNFEDFKNALIDLRHTDIVLLDQDEEYLRDGSMYIRRDPVFRSTKNFIDQQFKSLSLNSFTLPKLRGRWVYLDGRIPRINENIGLKCKSQIISIRQKEKGEKNKQFNIIMDQPEAMLTGYELQYFKEVTGMLSEGNESVGKLSGIDITGNLSNLLPLFIKFFISTAMTDMKMSYFLQFLSNKYVEASAEFHLHQIFTCLWAYQGKLCLQVGMRIGKYLQKFQDKYNILRKKWIVDDEYEVQNSIEARNTSYCNIIKKIGIEIISGSPFDLNDFLIAKIQEDCQMNNELAVQCKEVMHKYGAVIQCLKEKSAAYWFPNSVCESNPYLMMSL